MSTLNLKQYLAKIDALLEDQYYDEAVFHSRHILSLFPKNLATYRRLGRAEIGANRWDDANTTLRRVLSFAPDDKIAHVGMSKVYQRTQKKEEALWHLERAYEQDPNNQEIIDELRDLYAAYKKVNNVRLQLTAGAVARQYTKNQLYPQAIKVLKDALRQTPQRVDLQLALARVYRESGDIVAAAETALDVLDTLPDCLDANYIMTEVWLSEQRPSDAQRYLSVVEALDPYLAMRLAQGKSAPDDLIELPEADYKKAGQIISDQNPDWLNQLDDDHKVVDLGGDWSGSPVDDPTLKLNTSDDLLLDLDLGDDDFSWLDEPTSPVSDEETVIPENSRKHTGLTGMLTKFDKNVEQENIPTEQIDLEDLFNVSDDDTSSGDDDDIMAWLTDATPDSMPADDKPAELPTVPHDKDDPMAWLKASGIEILDDSLSEDMLNKTKAPTEALSPDDPMAWLKASGVELSDEPDEQFTPYEMVDSTTLKNQDDDPMAWLRDSDVEFLDDEPLIKNFTDDDDLPSDEADPMAWLKDSGVELVDDEPIPPLPTPTASTTSPAWDDDSSFLDEMLSMEELTGQTGGLASVLNQPSATPEEDWQDTMANSNDDFPSWLSDTPPSDDDDFSFDDDQTEETPDWLMDSTSETNFDPNATNINFDFGDDEAEAVSDDETPDWLMDMKPAEQPVSADEFDFLSDESEETDDDFALADEEETPDWLMGATTSESEPSFDPDATNIGFNFGELTDETEETDDDFALTEDEETPDWLMDMKPTEQPVSADEFDFLSDDSEDDSPAWMTSDTFTENTSFDPDATNIGFNFAELSDEATETDDDFALTEDEETPDWLMGVSETVEETIQETSTDFSFNLADDEMPEDEEAPDWLSGISETEEETVEEEVSDFAFALADDETPEDEEAPDWLSGISETEEETVEEEVELSFLSDDLDDEMPEDEETPDWLSGMSVADDETDEEIETDFAFALADDETPDDEEAPDWLMGMSEAEDETVEEEVSDFAFALADDEMPEDEETPDWLSGISETEEETTEEEVELSFLSDDLDDKALVTEDAPDWLMGAHPDTDDSDEKALDWLADDEAPAEEETPSWLSALGDDDEPADDEIEWVIDETETIGEFDETVPVTDMALSLGDSVDASHTPAENAPDWLNALVPGLDIDFDADEDAQVEQSFADSAAVASASANFGWLTAIVESEVNQPPMTMPSASTIVKPAETPTQTTTSSPTPSTRKWSFSKPPAWLNRGGAQPSAGIKPINVGQNQATTPSTSSTIDDDFDDMDFEDDGDDDLPDWLRDDNDDEPDFLRDNF